MTIDTRAPEAHEPQYAVIGGHNPQPLKLTTTQHDAEYEAEKILRSDSHPFVLVAKVEKVLFTFCYNCTSRDHRTEACPA